MKRTMKHITITALALALLCLCGCGRAVAQMSADTFASVIDVPHNVDASIRCVGQLESDEPDEAVEQDYSEYCEEAYYEDSYYEPAYYGGDSSDGFMQQGVREGVDSDTETWYSSARAYHKDTANWSTDDEGYYRTDEGYYVVASNDYEYGTVRRSPGA